MNNITQYFFLPLLASGLTLVLLSCASTSRTDTDYRNINDVIPSESYSTATSGSTNDTYITGKGNTIVLTAGIPGFAVNGEWHELQSRPIYRGGDLHVSRSDAGEIQRALSRAPSSQQEDRSPERTQNKNDFTVVVDPGHGGKFVGAEGIHGTLEKELNLAVAHYLRRSMQDGNVDVRLTRSSDTELSTAHKRDLDRRVQIAKQVDADLFISIHANAARTNSANGFEILVSPRHDRQATINRLQDWYTTPGRARTTNVNGYSSYYQMYQDHRQKSKRLAQLIINEFQRVVPTGSRGVKQKSLHVLRNAPCPAVLVELGFMTNPREARLLTDPSYQRKLARNIAQAVRSFRGSLAHNSSK